MNTEYQAAAIRYGMDVLRRRCPTCRARPYQECKPTIRKDITAPWGRGKQGVQVMAGKRRLRYPHNARVPA